MVHPPVGVAPSLSSAVIGGAPWVRSASWIGRIRSANSASAATEGSACRGGAQPGVERGSGNLQEFAQPLHLDGVPVVGDELAHQFVSPAKYSTAWRRVSRSVLSSAFSVSTAATCARNCAPAQRRTRSRPIQIDGPAAELLHVVLAGRDRGSFSLPRPRPDSACPRSRVKPRVPTTSVPASLLSRVGAAFAAMTAPSPADVGLGSVCPLIIGPRSNEAGIGYVARNPDRGGPSMMRHGSHIPPSRPPARG